ncbi:MULTISPECIES: hypothetical protein [Arthrobacter]|uniref:Apea-like HEPN domain-containing protein n=1 Tax=Arthrobacter terricola TaxID=2547396 RepID=A0A4R5KAQ0_9MICC|nr:MULTISPECIES: hypothetical protein [Arthrobacter]MBT8163194.1 hypothetical protein [Arthrobacter sp. GN70]TDF91548.1 hypothetical protein E1809_20695 [Arthrobacter terricola]
MVKALTSVVSLPSELPLLPEALGTKFVGKVALGRFNLLMPVLPAGPLLPALPLLDPLESPFTQAHGGPRAWGHTESSMPASGVEPVIGRVSAVVVEVDAEISPNELPDFAETFGQEFNQWYGIAISWIELWNDLNLTNLQESYPGTTGTIGAPDASGIASGWSPVERMYVTSAARAISEGTLALAFEKATADEHPPAEWVLYLQGAKTFDDRLAVIEAATAAEVALTGAIHQRLAQLTAEARELIVENANGLYGMVKLLQKIDAKKDGPTLDKVGKQLAKPRNKAVHAGWQPTNHEVREAFVIAGVLLEEYSPLPARTAGV